MEPPKLKLCSLKKDLYIHGAPIEQIDEGLLCGPIPRSVGALRDLGVEYVLDLSGKLELDGIEVVQFTWGLRLPSTPEVAEVIGRMQRWPRVYVSGPQHKVAYFVACWRIWVNGWGSEAAFLEMRGRGGFLISHFWRWLWS